MVSVVVATEPPIEADAIGADMRGAGFTVIACGEATERLFQAAMQQAPELIVAVCATPSDLLLASAALLRKVAPCPFVLFTSDAAPGRIERAVESGVHSYVVDGYAPGRLRSVAQVALARFRHEQRQVERVDHLARDLQDRKQIERAKGLLMRSRGLNEAGAFELMRSLAMRRRLRLASVAESVVALSIGAEAVNRSGQLRMLAQRLMRCVVQLTFGVHAEWAAANLRDCRQRIESTIAALRRTVADRGCAADIDRIDGHWAAMLAAIDPLPGALRLAAVDAIAEALTGEAEALTGFLETSGLVTNLRVVNLAGRQRMLSQRVGKLCLLLALDVQAGPAGTTVRVEALRRSAGSFATALAELERMPIHTPEIDRWLRQARAQWTEMLPYQRGQGTMPRCVEVCESLLETLEGLTGAYEQAAQVLVGDRMGRP